MLHGIHVPRSVAAGDSPTTSPPSCPPCHWHPQSPCTPPRPCCWLRLPTLPVRRSLCSAGCPGSALARMTCPQGGVDVPKDSGGCAAQIAPPLCDPGTHGAGIWVWGQQGPSPPQSLTCCAATLATLPGDRLGQLPARPNTSLGWWGQKVGPRRSLPLPLLYWNPSVLELSLLLSHRQDARMVRGSRWELI